ncbi:MAG: F0F1 ATP synthase subunit epsilon [Dinoroseobacter sp.]|nr:F0F1 ATP synthase subunit epsilon [Dinoroseobacter sp.]
MADTMQFDLVSPERRLASLEVAQVQIPGADGDMTAMPDHAPTITTLRPGVLSVSGPAGSEDYVVTGGFAEIGGGNTTVLAERAYAKADMTQDILDQLIAEAKSAHEAASAQALDDAAKLVADMVAMGEQIGLAAS